MENNLFKIHSDYKPTGDQPTAIEKFKFRKILK